MSRKQPDDTAALLRQAGHEVRAYTGRTDPADRLELERRLRDNDVKALVAQESADDLVRLHQGFSRSFDDIVRSGQPRASLEMTLVRLARLRALTRRLGPCTASGCQFRSGSGRCSRSER